MIMGIDPGKTTGVAVYDEEKENRFIEMAQIDINDSWEIIELIQEHQPFIVVIEKFVLYPWKSKNQSWSDLPAVQVMGFLNIMCRHLKVPTTYQYANQRKYVPEKIIEATNIKELGKGMEHAQDAALHVLYFLTTHVEGEAYNALYNRNRRTC